MSSKGWQWWFSTISIIMVLWGVVFSVFGLGVLPLGRDVLLRWESALYGAIMIGWGTTLFLIGRVALRRYDPDLMKPLFIGIVVWLLVEAACSARYGIWFNVGVDVAVLALFGMPLIASMRIARNRGQRSIG